MRGNVGLLHGAFRRKRNTGDMYGVVRMVWIALDSLWVGLLMIVWLID